MDVAVIVTLKYSLDPVQHLVKSAHPQFTSHGLGRTQMAPHYSAQVLYSRAFPKVLWYSSARSLSTIYELWGMALWADHSPSHHQYNHRHASTELCRVDHSTKGPAREQNQRMQPERTRPTALGVVKNYTLAGLEARHTARTRASSAAMQRAMSRKHRRLAFTGGWFSRTILVASVHNHIGL